MVPIRFLLVAALLVAIAPAGAAGAGPVKIGLITTLSGPAAYTGQDVRDGFMLAVDEESGKLGGVPVSVDVEDDGLNPATGREIADRFLQQDKMKIVTGPVFSNVMGAIAPDVASAGSIYVSPNAGDAAFAGASCNKNIFVASFNNDAPNIPAGMLADRRGWKKMVLMASDYVAGHDMVNGFKLGYKGEGTEIFPKLNQLDYSAEIARIRAADAQGLFYFLPGGAGINFLKQYAASGVKTPILVTVFSLDQRILAGVGSAAEGASIVGHWNTDFPNAANKRFVSDFVAKYHRDPTFYAADAYDTAHLIGSALKAAGGDDSKIDVLRDALRKADIASVRGSFKFGPNQFPIETWYEMAVQAGADGKLAITTKEPIVKNFGDPFSSKCKM